MSLNAQGIIQSSLRLIGVLASGESPSSSEASDGLTVLNEMIDSWSIQNLLVPNKTMETFPFVSNQQTYTMGPGGNFNTTRPLSIIRANIEFTSSSPYAEIPMEILTFEQYAGIILKTITSDFPLYLYSDNANPLTNINVWPVPTNSANNIVLYTWKPLSDLASLTTTPTLPPGYERALRYNLAVELSAEYGKQLSPLVISIAQESKAEIKRMNHRPRFLQVDNAVRASGGTYNWRTDGYER